MRSQQGIEAQAIEVLDRDIAAAEAAVAAAHRELDRALAVEAEARAAAAIAEAYSRVTDVLPSFEAQLNEVEEKVGAVVHAWAEVTKNESGHLFGGNDARGRLLDARLDRLQRLRQLVKEVTGTAPELVRLVPHLPASFRGDQQVIEMPRPVEQRGIVIRTPEESAARVKRFDFGQRS